MLQRVPTSQVEIGMFVQGFEGSWWKHPFWKNHFLITTEEQLERVRSAEVDAVIIDTAQGKGVAKAPRPDFPAPDDAKPSDAKTAKVRSARAATVAENPKAYLDENARAAKIVDKSKRIVRAVFDDARLGKAVRVGDVVGVVDEIADSIERMPKALLRVIRLKSKDEYTCLHSVAVCVLMVNLARQLQLPQAQMHSFGMAGLLHDVGKMAVPVTVLNKPGRLDEAEFALMREHPERGFVFLSEGSGLPAEALDVCRHHHERMDGSGYPFGLSGEQLSLPVRMGAICDVYDALTSNRVYKDAWTPTESVAAMRSWDGHFDPRILFAFMQSVSVFPAGMLVRLRSNRLAVVLDNGRRATRPRVKAFYDARARETIPTETVIIDDNLAHDQIVSEEDPRHWGLENWAELQMQLMMDS